MNKELLKQYVDACALIRETEEDILKLQRKKKQIPMESVKGSNPEYPYTKKSFHIEGAYASRKAERIREEEKLLEERKEAAECIKQEVERNMVTLPARIQRIIRYKYFEGLSWRDTAQKMGRSCTEDSVRAEFKRYVNGK